MRHPFPSYVFHRMCFIEIGEYFFVKSHYEFRARHADDTEHTYKARLQRDIESQVKTCNSTKNTHI